jgi:hypothetical protein
MATMAPGNRIVFKVGPTEKFFLISIALCGMVPLFDSVGFRHADPQNNNWVLTIPGVFFALFAVYYAYSSRLIVDDDFIIKEAIGKFQAMRFDDIESWRVQKFAFGALGRHIIRSRSGLTLDFTTGVDRPLELERILESATLVAREE